MTEQSDPAKRVETRTAMIWLRDDGIIAQRMSPNAHQLVADARETIAAVATLAEGRPRASLLDIRGGYTAGPGVRELYFSAEGGRDLTALAVLVTSVRLRTTGNVVLALSRPSHPIRLFTDEERALAWLKPFVRADGHGR